MLALWIGIGLIMGLSFAADQVQVAGTYSNVFDYITAKPLAVAWQIVAWPIILVTSLVSAGG